MKAFVLPLIALLLVGSVSGVTLREGVDLNSSGGAYFMADRDYQLDKYSVEPEGITLYNVDGSGEDIFISSNLDTLDTPDTEAEAGNVYLFPGLIIGASFLSVAAWRYKKHGG